jgi:hypothetical protein
VSFFQNKKDFRVNCYVGKVFVFLFYLCIDLCLKPMAVLFFSRNYRIFLPHCARDT